MVIPKRKQRKGRQGPQEKKRGLGRLGTIQKRIGRKSFDYFQSTVLGSVKYPLVALALMKEEFWKK